MIKECTTEDLRRMEDQRGLILQGCGGPAQEWLDGINNELTTAGILLNGSKFEDVLSFRHEGLTDLLFIYDGVDLDIGRLAVWRLQTYGIYGGTWLSDFVPNCLGGFTSEQQERQKPDCELIGQDGNVFNLIGIAARTLRRNGMDAEAREMQGRITGGDCHSYYDALNIIGEYVNITGPEEHESGMEMEGMW